MTPEQQQKAGKVLALTMRMKHCAETGQDLTISAAELREFIEFSADSVNFINSSVAEDVFPDVIGGEDSTKSTPVLSPQPFIVANSTLEPPSKWIPKVEYLTGKTLDELKEKINEQIAQSEDMYMTNFGDVRFFENVGFVQFMITRIEVPVNQES